LKLGALEKYTEVLRGHWFPSLGCVRVADITRNPIILPLARTGMRIGEALALQTADIDIDRRCIHIVRTWGSRTKADQEHRFDSAKSKRDRLVDMSKQLTGMMKPHLAQKASPTEWVFPGKDPDMPIHPVTFLGRWTEFLSQAGVAYRKPHTLSHTYASLLIQSGESLAYVRDQLGHSSIKITVGTYGHLVPGANEAAVDRLAELTGRNLYAAGA
jgi:integrase